MESKLKLMLRPSTSAPSLKDVETRPESIKSTRSKASSFRHGLLKIDSSIDHSAKDLPAPPVLTPGAPKPTGRNITMKHRFSSVSVPSRKSSKANVERRSEGTLIIDDTKRPHVVCLDPTMHPLDMHAAIHHPGLVTEADFCDAGVAIDRDSPIITPPSRLSPLSDIISTAPVYRILSGGNIHQDVIDVSAHTHKHHSSAVKVRPAAGLLPKVAAHEGHSNISKVQPAAEDPGGRNVLTSRVSPSIGPSSPLSSEHTSNHEGHIWVPKVQPYHESSVIVFKTEENSLPKLSVASSDRRDEDSSKGSSYWGFLPKFGDKKDEKSSVADESLAHPASPLGLQMTPPESRSRSVVTTRIENRPSSQYSTSQKSFDVVPRNITSAAESIDNRKNVRHDNRSVASPDNISNTSPRQEEIALQDNEEERALSTGSVSPTSHPRHAESLCENDDQGQTILPQSPDKNDPWRAGTWLRQFLGYPESTDPNLTQLPEMSHPRHEEHYDYPNDIIDEIASRVTTFSEQSAADAGTMDATMHNLERLLNEALNLAGEATEHDHCGYTDDGNLSSHLHNTSESIQPDVHEKIRSPSKDTHELIVTKVPQHVFVGAPEGFGHGCEALSSRWTDPRGLVRPDMRNGNISRSSYPTEVTRERSVHNRRKSKQKRTSREKRHVSSDDSVLPMPPSDSKIKRRCPSPIPHAYDEDDPTGVIKHRARDVPNSREVREYIRVFHHPPITSRNSSRNLREASPENEYKLRKADTYPGVRRRDVDVCSLDGGSDEIVDFSTQYNTKEGQDIAVPEFKKSRRHRNQDASPVKTGAHHKQAATRKHHELRNISLHRRSHSVKRQPTIARDWSPIRKRFVASVACLSTALIGVLVGIYAGLVPSMQYYIADFNHYTILGNVGMYLGMALTNFLCWPLPLLHGRKPYIVCSLCVAMPLLFPQAIAVSVPRSPYTSAWRWALLLPRALMGCALGFANMNFHSILTDLFGASLMSSNPHQEVVDRYDVRRHGGGLGVWLGIWTWCFIGSLGIGFLLGAIVIDNLQPSWGLYISIMLIAVVLLLNVLCPEVRRSAWRRSVAEVKTSSAVSRRVARGEVKMHRVKDGPKWWGEEMYHGVALSLEMLRQPGFVIMALYSAYIYAQVVLVIVLLGSLTSRYYRFKSTYVGTAVSSVAIGALLAVPFQMANLFSRARSTGPLTNSMTFDKRLTWTSHLVRRAIFVIVLPIAGDTMKRTNYSSFPRVTAGWNLIHSVGFAAAAAATWVGGIATRSLGQRAATGVVASALFLHSILLLGVFTRFRHRPIILGNPSEKFRRMNILELGSLTRWSEIRKKNRLIDEGAHLNRQVVDLARGEIGRRGNQGVERFGEIVRKVSKRSMRSRRSRDSDEDNIPRVELRDIGPLGPPGAGLEHHHSELPPTVYFERECIMGQTLPEEAEEAPSTDSGSDDDYDAGHLQEHSSHMTSKVQPYAGFRKPSLRGAVAGTDDYAIDTELARGEHASHAEAKVKPADPRGSEHREQHGAHMTNKIGASNQHSLDTHPQQHIIAPSAGDHSTGATMKLYAIGDLHLSYEYNRKALDDLTPHLDDGLILCGDVGESADHLNLAFRVAKRNFKDVWWCPGNHELYTLGSSPRPHLRGEAKYRRCVELAREHGVLTPEDEFVVWGDEGEGEKVLVCPVFTLYDYSFRPKDVERKDALKWAEERDTVATDEFLLHPDPYATRDEWCRVLVDRFEKKIEEARVRNPGLKTVLVNHWPLREDLVFIPRVPRFSLWCGTTLTREWHARFDAKVVVSGHLHVPRTDWKGGVRFEECSLGYPKQWQDVRTTGKDINDLLREIMPGPSPPPGGEAEMKWRRWG
ncbi:uncharacterized protein GGS22DRAFT_179463 [Annulohypoxylon maeteangense]|uniref:uncharacterized protein n=1 Tax=Annulohypoxylon maeteangense TaxID=1927788 RepID=UPI002007F605|nr:uncharacterized protein GGS22DRAFT_179463 [Annulohypoxylon maeteangense]KAI0885737.1 hypothetical protein GGS22DRAFT_179463 [Annulohypoxylon maeteangense]